jgi:hypothetical protein
MPGIRPRTKKKAPSPTSSERASSGLRARRGGLIWRAADGRNNYLARANPLEQNLRIYQVMEGGRHMLQDFDQIIDVTKWHTLHVVAKECRLQVLYDNGHVFDICDRTFSRGRIGLWTKSDAVSYFDDLPLQIVKYGAGAHDRPYTSSEDRWLIGAGPTR